MLKEIRNQPEHIRAIFMWLSVFIVFSLVIFIWANSFQQKLALLLNSEEKTETTKQQSPLAVISSGFNDLRATIIDLFGLATGTRNQIQVIDNLEKRFNVEPRLLPLSEDRKEKHQIPSTK